jgi:Calponin homology (CH) domain
VCLANLRGVLDFMKEEQIDLVNIGPEDVYDGNETLVLAALWALIRHYQVDGHLRKNADQAHDPKRRRQTMHGEQLDGKKELLEWVAGRVRPFDVRVTDFGQSFKDGRAFAALCASIDPSFSYQRSASKTPVACTVGYSAMFVLKRRRRVVCVCVCVCV